MTLCDLKITTKMLLQSTKAGLELDVAGVVLSIGVILYCSTQNMTQSSWMSSVIVGLVNLIMKEK